MSGRGKGGKGLGKGGVKRQRTVLKGLCNGGAVGPRKVFKGLNKGGAMGPRKEVRDSMQSVTEPEISYPIKPLSHPRESTSAATKRRWNDREWDVAIEAQSFVAVYADAPASESPAIDDEQPPTKTATTKKRKSQRRNASKTQPPPSEETVIDAPVPATPDAFWLAQLQDDVTENMLESDARVRITWLNRVAGDHDRRYEMAYDDVIDVQTILCPVYVVETHASGPLELTVKSAARIDKSVRRTRGELTPEQDAEVSEDEAPPIASRRRKQKVVHDLDDDDDMPKRRSTGGGRRVLRATVPKKLSKRMMAMHILPHYTTVDETKYSDRELLGTHAFDASSGDLLSSNREVLRAVRTQNYELLNTLIEDPSTLKRIFSFHAYQSADVETTAMQYAIRMDDVQAVTLLQQAHKVAASAMAKTPNVSLPSHSTGSHTSAYSDYNRREINASRGGREGNNALLADCNHTCTNSETDALWTHPQSSVKMLTVLYPAGEWRNDYRNPEHVANVLRTGNVALASKMVEVLGKNGGWGYNDLHVLSLSTTDQPLPTFRSVSVVKKAQQTKITPLHVAAINPNVKYLEALWENGGSEQSNVRDDAQFEPIHYAAVNESPSAVRFLLEHKANLLSRTKAKHTPLMRALLMRREATAIAMLEHVATEEADFAKQVLTSRGPESYQLIHFAADNNCLLALKHLLTMGVDVNALAAGQTTALSLAARRGHFHCVKLLLDHGAKIDRADKLKKTPLLLAVKNGHTRIAAYLINHGANVNAYDSSENSIVHYAASYGWMSCLELLFDAGADLWSRNSWGFVPLICAMLKNRAVCAEFILKSDNEQRFLDFRDRSGRTMLFLQCEHSTSVDQIEYLLEKGLDPNIGDCNGKQPLDVLIDRAASAKADDASAFLLDAVRALVARGAEVNYEHTDEEGKKTYPRQPLQVAMRNNARAIFDFLLETGADPLIVETYGTDAWLTSASLGAQGAYFLEKLLAKYPTPRAVTLTSYSSSIFHLIASTASSEMISPDLVEKLLTYCTNAVELLHEANSAGVTPLMALYEARNGKTNQENDQRKQQDQAFCKIARLFAARITEVEALKKYVTIRQKIDKESPSTEPDNMETIRVLDSTILHVAVRLSVGSAPAPSVTASTSGNSLFGNTSTSSGFGFGATTTSAFASQPTGFGFGAPATSAFGTQPPGFGFGASSSSAFSPAPAGFGVVPPTTSGFSFGSPVRRPGGSSSPSKSTKWHGENLVALLFDACPISTKLVDVKTRHDHETPLLVSVNKNDVVTARVLLSAGADPNYSSFRCKQCPSDEDTKCTKCLSGGLTNTALIQAVSRKQVDMLKLLLESGASTDCCSSGTLDTPLHLALTAGKVEHTRLLLEYGASMVKLNAAKSTPLAAAISGGYSVTTRKPHEGEITFSTAALGRDCKPPAFLPSGATSAFGQLSPFAVSKAAKLGADTVIDVALGCAEAVAAILTADENERTPLHHAAAKRDLPLLRALLQRVSTDKAAYVNKPDIFGRTALHFALNSVTMKPDASFDVERFLFLSGARASAIDNFGLSPLHYALRKIDMDWHLGYDGRLGHNIVKEQKATGEYETKKATAFTSHLHDTPSTPADPVETVSNLIAAGCDPLVADGLGRSPLHLAASIGAFVCASTLLSACPSTRREQFLEQQDVDGFSPLGRAFEHARETTITTLIQSGACVTGTVKIRGEERSYFSVAVEKSMSGICHMLLNAGFCRRQAVEDAVCGNQLQLAKNLMVGLEISNDRSRLVNGNSRGETLLHCLAKSTTSFGDLADELAWTLVDDGLDVTAQDDDGNTALHHAAAKSNARLMDFLLHHGSDVNARNKAGASPLMHALVRSSGDNRLVVMQYMLLREALDLRMRDSAGFDIVALFMKHFLTAFETDTKLHLWFELALRRHGDLDQTYASMTSAKDIFGNPKLGISSTTVAPLLIWAAYAKTMTTRCQLLRILLQQGASPSVTDSNGNSVLIHLVTRNMLTEVALVLQESKVKSGQVQTLVDTATASGQTALHLAIAPLEYGSYENIKMIELLVDNGASLDVKDASGASPIDYATRQASRRVFRFLKNRFPTLVHVTEEAAFDDAMDVDQWRDAPDFAGDAETYLNACEAEGKITKTRKAPRVNRNCDVGAVNAVFGALDDDGNVIEGEEYNALLTKVDVKHGKHGINVFYRMQVVHDELQNIYIVFTNWGRIGEEGKFQNTPFHSADEAVTEFKKIFRSKTSNHWEDRHNFEKRVGKYNLVQRVNYVTKIDRDVTQSFTEHLQYLKSKKIDTLTEFAPLRRDELDDPNILNALWAITDVHNLQLAANNCQYYADLPVARDHELRAAMAMLSELRAVVIELADVKKEMDVVSGNLVAEDASAQLTELSDKHDALMEDLSERSSRYYEIVPRNEDRYGAAIGAFDDLGAVDKELYRLKRLLEITHTYKMLLGAKLRQKIVHPMEYVVDSLQIQIARLTTDNDECKMLTTYFTNGIRPNQRRQYSISNVFEVTRKGEAQRLSACLDADAALAQQHTTLLWHGTNRANLMGILSEGLRIAPPEASHNGYAYGKGIYFSDVAAKSLNYCHSAYTIEEEVEEADGTSTKITTKTRQVYYMLLCEVALGNQKRTQTSSMYNREALVADGYHSVCAVGHHMPNPTESLVSPVCGATVPLGRVGRPGEDFERPSAWAVHSSSASSYSNSYSFQSWQFEAEAYLNKALESSAAWHVGDVIAVTEAKHKALFVRQGWYGNELGDDTKVEIRVTEVNDAPGSCDIGVEFVVTPPPPSSESTATATTLSAIVLGKARRYHDVNYNKLPTLPTGHELPQLSAAGSYNEHIVYATDQVRVRYVVEVDLKQ